MRSKYFNLLLLEIPDEVDFSLPGGAESYIYYDRLSSEPQFILSVWVRYRRSFNGTFLSLHKKNTNRSLSPILTIDESAVTLYRSNGTTLKTASFASTINDAYWHHIIVNMTGQSSVISHNDKILVNIDFESDNSSYFDPRGVLIVGNHTERPSAFVGEVSQLAIWTGSSKSLESLSTANCSMNLTGMLNTLLCSSFKIKIKQQSKYRSNSYSFSSYTKKLLIFA